MNRREAGSIGYHTSAGEISVLPGKIWENETSSGNELLRTKVQYIEVMLWCAFE